MRVQSPADKNKLCYTFFMKKGGKQDKAAHIVAVNMGYGHERPAFSLRHLGTKQHIIIANQYDGIPESDRRLWDNGRKIYERISRLKRIPLVGPLAFRIMDEMQEIPSFYPRRDLSRPNLQLLEFYALIRKRGFMRHLMEELSKDPKPLLCTFMTPAFAAEEFGYPEEIYVLATDSDISRTWAPLHPKRSRIRYLAPTGRVRERLKLYGVLEDRIELTGFPLPMSAIGGSDSKTIKGDLARRICHLDPSGIFLDHSEKMLRAHLGPQFCPSIKKKNGKAISLAFAVGGAGAQRDIGVAVAKSLIKEIRQGNIQLTLIAGSRQEVTDFFTTQLKQMGLARALTKGQVRILHEPTRTGYFQAFEKLVREIDILWTKPSELSFYTGLGIPIIMAPPVGSQENFNRQWLMQIGGGVDQLDPRYTNEWLFDWIASGALARMAWHGFIEAPTHGTYRIADIIAGRPNTIHPLPLVI